MFFRYQKNFLGCQKKFKNFFQKIFFYVCIDAEQLPIEKVTYFRNLIICYEKMEKVTYRNREKYAIIARVISGEILLPKKKHCYTSECE